MVEVRWPEAALCADLSLAPDESLGQCVLALWSGNTFSWAQIHSGLCLNTCSLLSQMLARKL